jgi:hypothetical protein
MIGPNPTRENAPSYIDTTISAGYEVEVDINYIKGKFYLGHDTPDYEISEVWMEKRKDKIWFHCKNLDVATKFCDLQNGFKFFCHSSDTFVLTSTNHIWVHDLTMNLNNRSIIPLLSKVDIENYRGPNVYGVCTDYINFLSTKVHTKRF